MHGSSVRHNAPASLSRRKQFLQTTVLLLVLSSIGTQLHAQGTLLLPSIGLRALPDDGDPVCPIPPVTGFNQEYRDMGLEVGTPSPDFTLYDLNGRAFSLSAELEKGKPVLLIGASYTCPVFRAKVSLINNLLRDYGDKLTIAIIYTLEAHPLIDTSVYYGYVNTTPENEAEGVLYRQPQTYGERKRVVADMLAAMSIHVPVYIDGPCNEWWERFGPAPNNAYLIKADGIVFAKQGWFNRAPDNIRADITRLLDGNIGEEDSANGSFQFVLTSPNFVIGNLGEVLHTTAELRNSSTGRAEIDILRENELLPEGWSTALCTDICLEPWVDSTRVVLEPGEKQEFTFYIYSGAEPGTAHANVIFRNIHNPQNRYGQTFGGRTDAATSNAPSEGNKEGKRGPRLSLLPNPATTSATATLSVERTEQVRLEIFDPLGRRIATLCDETISSGKRETFALPLLPSGLYFVRLQAGTEEELQALRINE